MREKDMYLPNWLRYFGFVLMLAGVICAVLGLIVFPAFMIVGLIAAVFFVGMGIAAELCWKNQWAEMLNDKKFVYSTMFGKQHQYRFSEIKGVKHNSDSMTLLLENGKVHIESCAIVSERFAERLNDTLGLE